jgi:hypothetical protein
LDTLSSLDTLRSLDKIDHPPTPPMPMPMPMPMPTKIKKTRCKRGERKNKLGVCEKKSSVKDSSPDKIQRSPSVIVVNSSSNQPSLHTTASYRPSINKQLVSIKSASSDLTNIEHCNVFDKYTIDFPLKIKINGKCTSVRTNKAKQYLLKALKHKHLNITKLILPKQYDTNCWFNTFFTCMFISDKGRQFSLYFRQLMIEGKLHNNDVIPEKLINVFSLLNYFIHCCLAGDHFALNELNTNTIIHYIYENMPKTKWIVPPKTYGSPIIFYVQLLSYLSIKSIILKKYGSLESVVFDYTQVPDIMILTYEGYNYNTNKKTNIAFDKYKYELDSVCILDNSNNHFACLIHCNKEEYGYDGASSSRLYRLQWTKLLNANNDFTFIYDAGISPVYFNFLKGWSILIYYRKS